MPATDPALVLPAATEHSLSAQLSTIPLSADTPAMRCPVLTNRMLELSVLRSCLPRAYAGSTRPITLCFRCAMSDTHTAYAASPSAPLSAYAIPGTAISHGGTNTLSPVLTCRWAVPLSTYAIPSTDVASNNTSALCYVISSTDAAHGGPGTRILGFVFDTDARNASYVPLGGSVFWLDGVQYYWRSTCSTCYAISGTVVGPATPAPVLTSGISYAPTTSPALTSGILLPGCCTSSNFSARTWFQSISISTQLVQKSAISLRGLHAMSGTD
eukprot:952366-Rhodomonas_salina.1